MAGSTSSPKVGLFVTCLVDLFRPTVGFAAIRLLEQAGCLVEVPWEQGCCGQSAYCHGDRAATINFARRTIDTFGEYDYLVAPSGACTSMIRNEYPRLLTNDPLYSDLAETLAAKSYELTQFLVDVLGHTQITSDYPKRVTLLDTCTSLTELNIRCQARQLLGLVKNLELCELPDAEQCCGFGSTNKKQNLDVANGIFQRKAQNLFSASVEVLCANEMGCLLHMANLLARQNSPVEVRHIAEILADMAHMPPIGAEQEDD